MGIDSKAKLTLKCVRQSNALKAMEIFVGEMTNNIVLNVGCLMKEETEINESWIKNAEQKN